MNELKGSFVNIVLSVQEGRGFAFLEKPAMLVANLSGRIIESDVVNPTSNPLFNTELVWETEKKEVRKLRSSNIPLRVECCMLDARKERIGFLLLSLRSAQVIVNDGEEMKMKWFKLLGVQAEHRANCPELYLSCTIRDRNYKVPVQHDYIAEQTVTSTSSTIPITCMEEGFVQIGNGKEDKETFQLSFLLGTAHNLDLLLPEHLVFTPSPEPYYISFYVFDLEIKTKSFFKDLHEPVVLNDKLVLRLRTSVGTLRKFFAERPSVQLTFHSGLEKLASTAIRMDSFLQEDQQGELKLHVAQWCSFDEERFSAGDRQPRVQTETDLQNCCQEAAEAATPSTGAEWSTSTQLQLDRVGQRLGLGLGDFRAVPERASFCPEERPMEAGESPRRCDRVEGLVQAGAMGEGLGSLESFKATIMRAEEPSVILGQACSQIMACDQTLESLHDHLKLKKTPEYAFMEKTPLQDVFLDDKTIQEYHQYSLEIVVESVEWKKSFGPSYTIVFQHPKACSRLEVFCETSPSAPARCLMYFIATEDKIQQLINVWQPKVSLVESKQRRRADLAVLTQLFGIERNSVCRYKDELRDEETFADAYIMISLKKCDLLLPLDRDKEYELGPVVLDERLAVRSVGALERWKAQQKSIHEMVLKELEKQRLEELNLSWTRRRDELEKQLLQGMAKCHTLTQQLELLAGDPENAMFKENMTREEFEEKMSFAEERFQIKLQLMQVEKEELQAQIERLQREKNELKEIIDEKTDLLNDVEKTALTPEQTANLLQEIRLLEEKLEVALAAKTFFKEQWRKAAREIHCLRAEDYAKIKVQIQHQKEELSQLNLDEFFNEDERDAEDLIIDQDDIFSIGQYSDRTKCFFTGFN